MRCRFAVGLALTCVLASCSDGSATTLPVDEPAPPRTRGPASYSAGESVDCALDRRVIEAAAAVYSLTFQRNASSIDDLTEFGVMDETSRWTVEVPTDGGTGLAVVAPLPGGPCAG